MIRSPTINIYRQNVYVQLKIKLNGFLSVHPMKTWLWTSI
jgi:hypothetical protein